MDDRTNARLSTKRLDDRGSRRAMNRKNSRVKVAIVAGMMLVFGGSEACGPGGNYSRQMDAGDGEGGAPASGGSSGGRGGEPGAGGAGGAPIAAGGSGGIAGTIGPGGRGVAGAAGQAG